MKQKHTIYHVSLTALFAATVTVFTAYIAHIPVGANGGYIHLGDAIIYLAACILPTPYAVAAGAIGGGLADLLSGAANWILPTVLVKSALALCFTSKQDKILAKRNFIAPVLGIAITVLGYFVAEGLMYQNWPAAFISNLTAGAVQAVGSAVLFYVVSAVLDKARVKERYQKLTRVK